MAVSFGTSPAGVSSNTSGTSTLTTASFSPPAKSLVVAFTAGRGSTSSTTPTATVTDSSGATWTELIDLEGKTTNGATNYCEGTFWYTYFNSAPGSITVNASWTGRSGRGAFLKVYVLNGADPVPSMLTQANIGSTSFPAVTDHSTAVGSWLIGMAVDEIGNTFTSAYNTGQVALDYNFDGTNMSAVTVNGLAASTSVGQTFQVGAKTTTASGGMVLVVEVLPYNPKTADVVDAFTTYDSTTWAFSYGTPSVTSGQLHLNCTSSYEGIYSGITYDLTSSSISLQTVQVPTGGNGTRQAYMKLNVDGSNNVEFFVNGGVLYCRKTEAGTTTTLHTVGNYNSTNHAYWKIQSDNVSGTDYVSFWTSPNGAVWSQQGAATTTSFSQTALYVEVGSGYTGTETSPPDFVVDNMNIAPTTVAISDTDYQRVESLYGFYAGSGSTGVSGIASHETLVGRSVEIASDYLPHNSWTVFNASTMRTNQLDGWRTWRDARPGSKFVYGIPLLTDTNTGDFAGVVAGTYDTYFNAAASALVAAGHSDAIIRLGWEPNNSGIGPWQATDNPSGYISAFQHVVTRFRAASGQNFKFEMSSALGFQAGHTIDAFDDYYPGSSYVDYLGMNVYDIDFNDPTYISPEARWTWIRQQVGGLDDFIAYAASKGKPIVTSEWGVYATGDSLHGGGDNPYFITQMIDYFNRAKPYYQCYFNSDWGGGVLSDFTNSQTTYANYFATPGFKESNSLSITQNVSSSDSAHGTESQSISARLNSSQTASGSDSGSVRSNLNSSDSASGAEASSLVKTSSVSSSDAASGTEAWSIVASFNKSDSASGADSSSLLTITSVSSSDAASGAEGQSLVVSVNSSQSASGTESASIGAALNGSDSASGVESSSLVKTSSLSSSDSSSAVDSQTIVASWSGSDSASGAENAPRIAVSDTDAVEALESTSSSSTLSSSDAVQSADLQSTRDTDVEYDESTSVENQSVGSTLSNADLSSVTETVAVAFNNSDSASGVEHFTVQVIALDSSSATESQALALASLDTSDSVETSSIVTDHSSVDDSSSAEDAMLVASLSDLDSSGSVETSTTEAGLADADESSTEYTAIIAVSDADAAQADEDQTLVASISDADTSGAEEALALALADFDVSYGDEYESLAADLSDADLSLITENEGVDTGGSPFQLDPIRTDDSHSILARSTWAGDGDFEGLQDRSSSVEALEIAFNNSDASSGTEAHDIAATAADVDTFTSDESASVVVSVSDSDIIGSVESESFAISLAAMDDSSATDTESVHIESAAPSSSDGSSSIETWSIIATAADNDGVSSNDTGSFEAQVVSLDSASALDDQSIHIEGVEVNETDSANASEAGSITVYVMSSDGVTAIETDNLSATLEDLDNSTLLETWLVGQAVDDSDSVSALDSESIQTYEILGLAGIIENLDAKWSLSDSALKTDAIINDIDVKWVVETTTGKTVQSYDLDVKWVIANLTRSY